MADVEGNWIKISTLFLLEKYSICLYDGPENEPIQSWTWEWIYNRISLQSESKIYSFVLRKHFKIYFEV